MQPRYSKPRIGITCDSDTSLDRRGSTYNRFLLQELYVSAVSVWGAIPLLLPFIDPKDATETIHGLDGLLITGGDFDIPPSMYQQEAHPLLGKTHPLRTASEQALLLAALNAHIPVLGICGGMQLINVVLGGTLHQDLSLRPHTQTHQQDTPKNQPFHAVHVQEHTLLAQTLSTNTCHTNSTHHQAINMLGKTLVASAFSEDGVVEALESTAHGWVLGVQWHPEAMPQDTTQQKIYRQFVHACAQKNV